MDEAQYLADRVVVITHGEIVAQGAPDTLAGRNVMQAKIRFRLRPGAPSRRRPSACAAPRTASSRSAAEDPTEPLHRLTGWALEQHVDLDGLEVIRPTLEDVYLELTGGEEVHA